MCAMHSRTMRKVLASRERPPVLTEGRTPTYGSPPRPGILALLTCSRLVEMCVLALSHCAGLGSTTIRSTVRWLPTRPAPRRVPPCRPPSASIPKALTAYGPENGRGGRPSLPVAILVFPTLDCFQVEDGPTVSQALVWLLAQRTSASLTSTSYGQLTEGGPRWTRKPPVAIELYL